MKVSAILFSLLVACQVVPAAAQTAGAATADIAGAHLADRFGPDKLRDQYRIAVTRLKALEGKRLVYTYDFVTDANLVLAGGNAIKSQNTTSYAYDDKGRSRVVSSESGVQRIVIADPTQHAVYLVCPERKEILRLKDPALDEAAPAPAPAEQVPGEQVVTADLGEKTIAGVKAHGSGSERTIPAGAKGNDKPLVYKSEGWYSQDLATIVAMRMSMPEIGDFYMHVENLKFGNVPASTFALPNGYRMVDIALHE
jgi:hypothetical protein